MPTTVPFAEFSATVPPDSVALAGASLTFVTPIVNGLSNVSPPWSVTRTVIACEVALSKSSKAPFATVMTPVVASMAKRPPALLVSEYVNVAPASGSCPVTVPTTVALAELSATVPPASVAPVGASLTLVTPMVNDLAKVSPAWLVTRTVTLCDVALS